ncbi:MAG: ribosome biogenesis GTPase YlqF [Clostridiaceae bacterium]
MLIQWYPGHMAKARRMLIENLKLIDVVVELVDARAPLATRNPDFDDLFTGKERVAVLNKSDLAAPEITKLWVEHYKKERIKAVEFVSTSAQKRGAAVALIEGAAAEKVKKMRDKGVSKTVRAMIVGIPNVGKSTFINRIAGENRAQTGDKPGVTKGKQWVKITPYLELMDTPGLLWPKLENETLARHLAYIGSINDETMDVETLAGNLLCDLRRLCPAALMERYKKITSETADEALLAMVAQSRGFMVRGGGYDTERAARIALDEYRGGKIARVTLETPDFLEAHNGETQ